MLEELGKDTKKYTTAMYLHTLNHILVYIPFQVCQDIALLTLPKDHHHAAQSQTLQPAHDDSACLITPPNFKVNRNTNNNPKGDEKYLLYIPQVIYNDR